MKLKDVADQMVPGFSSGKLQQVIFGIPHYLHEVTHIHSWQGLHKWLYYKFPYYFSLANFPPFITISLTMRCNLSCVHCFRNIMPWRPHDMEITLFEKIIDEVAEHPECTLKIGGLGEPSVHPQIRDFLFLLAKKKVKTVFYTNGTLFERLTPQEIFELDFNYLVVSIDGIDAQSYESKRIGGNYGKLRANVVKFYQTRNELNSHRPLIEIRHVLYPNESRKELQQFTQDWLKFADTVMFCKLALLSPQPRVGSKPMFSRCRYIRREFYIGSGGQVPVCGPRLWGGSPKEIIGDLHHASIIELWHHSILNYVRSCHKNGYLDNLPFCKDCRVVNE